MSPADPSAVADKSRSPAAAAAARSTAVADNLCPVVVPDVGDRCRVNWRNGEILEAEIVARRLSKSYLASAKASERGGGRKRKSSGAGGDALTVNATSTLASSSGASSAAFDVSNMNKPRDVEYYVHYVGHDRRLDEWITFDKIEVESLQSAGSRGPTTTDSALQGVDDSSSMLSPAMGAGGITRRRSSAALGTSVAASSAAGSASDDDDQQQAMGSTGGGNFHPQDATFEREHEETTKIKNVERIIMGCHEVQCWYYSPFPDAYSNVSTLYVCEYCLTYMKKAVTYKRNHVEGCKVRCPPGRRIYLEGDLAVYEIDGKDHKPYCQKLCLLAKLFLDHKTLYYDVTPFLFYVVCTVDHHGAKMVGYFSKEKVSDS
jgi:MOZ/SAS family/MYST family zinc finger domain/RNA binding activity-knot of a chromodomain